MWQSIKNFLMGAWNKVFNKKQIGEVFGNNINISDKMIQSIQKWSNIYINQSPWLTKDIKSLGLGGSIPSELARLVTVELKSTVSGSERADFLNEQYKKILKNIREQTEYGLAKGGIVFKPYVYNENIKVDYVQADEFYPISFDSNGYVNEAIFVDQVKKGSNYFNKVEHHKFENGSETVKNVAFKSTSSSELGNQVDLSVVDEWSSLVPEITFNNLKKPMFAYFKNPMANTVEPGNPIGVSCFARSVDLMEEADKQWSRFLWENKSGERALHVDSGAFKKDERGNMNIPDERLYKTLESQNGESLFHDWTPELRNEPLLFGLDSILKKIEFNSGLAFGTISDPQSVDKTATEVKQSRQRSYSTVKDIQDALELALEHSVYIMDVLSTLYNMAPAGSYEVISKWDDSIIVDADAERMKDQQEVTMGFLSKVDYRIKWYGETREEAQKKIDEIKATIDAPM